MVVKWIGSLRWDVPFEAEETFHGETGDRSQETGDRRQEEQSIEHREIISNFELRNDNANLSCEFSISKSEIRNSQSEMLFLAPCALRCEDSKGRK